MTLYLPFKFSANPTLFICKSSFLFNLVFLIHFFLAKIMLILHHINHATLLILRSRVANHRTTFSSLLNMIFNFILISDVSTCYESLLLKNVTFLLISRRFCLLLNEICHRLCHYVGLLNLLAHLPLG